jgi:hypothetical protein
MFTALGVTVLSLCIIACLLYATCMLVYCFFSFVWFSVQNKTVKFQNYDKVCLDVCGGGGGEQNLRQYQVRTGENQPNEFSSA